MIDKTLPKIQIALYKTDTKEYPKHDLPEGYSFCFYKKGDEVEWAKIECSIGQFASIDEGIESFKREFLQNPILTPEERLFFVKDENGEYVATAALWDGMYLGKKEQRVHWVAVSDKCAGKGIAKALLTRILDLYNELGFEGLIYLITATWYYPAISIYKKFGFNEYSGTKSLSDKLTDEEFVARNTTAITLINQKLSEYTKGGKK